MTAPLAPLAPATTLLGVALGDGAFALTHSTQLGTRRWSTA